MQLNGKMLAAGRIAVGQQRKKQVLVAEVVFGSARLGCRGTGICKLSTIDSNENQSNLMLPCRKGIALISVTAENQIRFNFEKASLCNVTLKKHFGSQFFILTEAFLIPMTVKKVLLIDREEIAPGVYPVLDTEAYVTVIF